jgi:hypothetical protein
MLETFGMQQEGTQYRRLIAAFQRIFGATIFFGTDTQREKAAVVHSARFSFLWASPDSEIGTNTMWSIPVIRSAAMPSGQFLVAALAESTMLFQREALTVEIAFQNEADFVNNLCALRAEERIALSVLLPTGLVTGPLPAGSMSQTTATHPARSACEAIKTRPLVFARGRSAVHTKDGTSLRRSPLTGCC